jgi:hypothetical protein
MSYILALGIILVIIPIVTIEVFAHIVLLGFIKDDQDASKLLGLAFGMVGFGALLIAIHFITGLAS